MVRRRRVVVGALGRSTRLWIWIAVGARIAVVGWGVVAVARAGTAVGA